MNPIQGNSENIEQFREELKSNHYSVAIIDILIKKIDSAQFTTFQEINDLFKRTIEKIVRYFIDNPQQSKLIQNKNPLCLQSIQQYLSKLFRGVQNKFPNVQEFTEALKHALFSQKQIIKNSTKHTAETGATFLEQQNYFKVMLYNYSKSVSSAIKKLSKKYGNNLILYVCHGGIAGEGMKMYDQLLLERINCSLIDDVEIPYYMAQTDCLLTGAEVVFEDGSIINRSGSYLAALCARQLGKPLIVFAQSYKYVKKLYLCQKDVPSHLKEDQNKHQPIILIDLIPSKMIKVFCTDIGPISPENIAHKMADLFQ